MSNPLKWIFTNYGLNRVAEAQADKSVILNIQKVKVGDANGDFYNPSATQTSLLNVKDSFMIHNLMMDSVMPNTVVFETVFPETSSGYEIREVGFYETIGNVDYLFALCTCEPLLKPSVGDGYAIAIDYSIYLKSVNLSSVYDQIKIDPKSQFVKQSELDNMNAALLYVEDNLSTEIMYNTKVIGLDRPEMLHEKINNNIINISNLACSDLMANVMRFCIDIDNIKSLWLFNYSRFGSSKVSVVDFSNKFLNLNLSKDPNLFERGYFTFAPYLNIDSSNYFSLGSDMNFNLLDSDNKDTKITFLSLMQHNNISEDNTILAKSDYSKNKHEFKISKLEDNSIEIVFYTDENNYISFKTLPNTINNNSSYVLAFKYNGNITAPELEIFINGLTEPCTLTKVGNYTGMLNNTLDSGSFIVDLNNNKIKSVNSKISIMTVIKEEINNSHIRLLSLNMMALSGKDVCISG